MSDPDSSSENAPNASVGRLVRDTVVLTVVLVALVGVAGWWFRDPLTDLADWLVGEMGVIGMFTGVFIADAFTFPLPPDFYLVVSIASGFDVTLTLVTCSVASVVAGHVAYGIGPQIEKIPLLRERLEAFRPRGEALFDQWGGWTVGAAALTPIPFSIVSWLAGIYRMPWRLYALAALCRIPRILGYYALYKMGWAPHP